MVWHCINCVVLVPFVCLIDPSGLPAMMMGGMGGMVLTLVAPLMMGDVGSTMTTIAPLMMLGILPGQQHRRRRGPGPARPTAELCAGQRSGLITCSSARSHTNKQSIPASLLVGEFRAGGRRFGVFFVRSNFASCHK